MSYWPRWDDPTIRGDDTLYRHVPSVPNPKKRQDPTDGTWSLTKAAFTSSEMKSDGWSTYRGDLMTEHGLTVKDIEESGEEVRQAWHFEVRHARSNESGVIDEIDPNGGQLGLAHGVVRVEDPTEGRSIRDVRDRIISVARPAEVR